MDSEMQAVTKSEWAVVEETYSCKWTVKMGNVVKH